MEKVFIPPMAGLGLGLHGLSMGLGLTSLTSGNLLRFTLVIETDEIKVFNVTDVDILKEVKDRLARHKNLFATMMSAMREEQSIWATTTDFMYTGNIMDEVDIEDLTIEQYLRLTQENQTQKKIEDMTIAEYMEYEKKLSENHISNTKTYLPTYFSKCAPTHDSIREFAHYFGPNQPSVESDCDSEDMEEEFEYMTNDEVVMSEQEKSNHGNTQNIQHFEEKDDVDKWLNVEITKHLSIQGVENTEDALISIIKSIKKEMKDGIMKKQIEASTANISSISSSEVDTGYDSTSPTASYLLPKELSP
ncbi:hypothetical protein Tco_1562808 [Tanacetum coccineum]